MKEINIIMIEDDPEFRNDFVTHCEVSNRLNCVFSVDRTEKLIKYFSKDLSIDIAVVDIQLPGLDGLEAINFIHRISKKTKIIVLSAHDDYNFTFRAIKHGAIGYLLKQFTFQEIENRIINLYDSDEIPLSPQIARRILRYFQPTSSNVKNNASKVLLTPKELLIIKHLTKGKSYEETAVLTHLSIHGVRYHIKNMYKKLHIKSKGELINLHLEGFFNKYFLR